MQVRKGEVSQIILCYRTFTTPQLVCSNNHLFYNIDDHLRYFEKHVSDYGIAGCPADPPVNGTTVSNKPARRYRNRNREKESVVDDMPEMEAIAMITGAAMARWAKDYAEYVWDWWHRKNGTLTGISGDAPFRPSW